MTLGYACPTSFQRDDFSRNSFAVLRLLTHKLLDSLPVVLAAQLSWAISVGAIDPGFGSQL